MTSPLPTRRLVNGLYKVIFIGQGTGNGVVIVKNGRFAGGDGYFYYSGRILEAPDQVTVEFEVSRHTPGGASVFGKDSLLVSLTGPAVSPREFQLWAPAKVFTITAVWLAETPV